MSGLSCWAAGASAESTPRHSSRTNGYSRLVASTEFGSATLPPVGWAPAQETSNCWRPRRFDVSLTDSATVRESTTVLVTPSVRRSRVITFGGVVTGPAAETGLANPPAVDDAARRRTIASERRLRIRHPPLAGAGGAG